MINDIFHSTYPKELSDNTIDIPFFRNRDSDYIPLYLLNASNADINIFNKYFNHIRKDSEDIVKRCYESVSPEILDYIFIYSHTYRGEGYLSLRRNKINTSLVTRGRNTYFQGMHTLILVSKEEKLYIPLYTLCIKKELARYALQCAILKRPIHKDALTLFVNDKLDKPNSEFGLLRPHYRKNVKNPLLKIGIEIQEVKNFDHIYSKLPEIKASTIDAYEESLTNMVKKAINFETELNNGIESNTIKLSY